MPNSDLPGDPGRPGPVTPGALAAVLWRERELLEQLLYALTCQQLLLASGGIRWISAADAQVRAAVDEVTACELQRAVVTHEYAWAVGLPSDAALEDLARAAEEPWDTVLGEHREALRELASEIGAVTAENRRLLHTGADIARDTLERARSATSGHRPDGGLGPGGRPDPGPMLLDRQA
ncbi:flagellar protein FlgN [Jatrophihabitans fulvus]